MQKKLLVIPMKGQYEQHCNAAALKRMGVPVIKSLKKKHTDKIKAWLKSAEKITVDYPDITEAVIDSMLLQVTQFTKPIMPGSKIASPKKLRKISLKKIIR
jgi:hypothetical protein